MKIKLSYPCPVCNKQLSHDENSVFCEKCKVYRKKLNFIQKQLAWALNKSWIIRLPILIWFGLMLVQNWKDPWYSVHQTLNPLVYYDFGIHELGHPLFSLFGTLLYIAGGCIFQCLFPMLWIWAFIKLRWYFTSALCWGWLGLNLFSVGAYAADARARLLPLGGWGALSGDNSDQAYDNGHDWYQLLSRTHHLNWDLTIGHYFRIAGTISFIICLTIGAILILTMMLGMYKRLAKNYGKKKNKNN